MHQTRLRSGRACASAGPRGAGGRRGRNTVFVAGGTGAGRPRERDGGRLVGGVIGRAGHVEGGWWQNDSELTKTHATCIRCPSRIDGPYLPVVGGVVNQTRLCSGRACAGAGPRGAGAR